MDINNIKTKVKQHKHITLKQKDNASPIELILCGEDGRPLTSLSGACTISLLDLNDKVVRSKINGQVTAGVVSFKVTDHLKANKHSIEIDVGGRKFPSDGDFIVQVSMSHDQVELNIISSQTATTVMNGLYDKIIAYMNANPNLFRGNDGKDGKPFTYDMFTSAQLAALKGDKGDKGEPFKFTDFTKSQLDTINTQVASILQPSVATQVQAEFSKLSAKQQQEAEVINARNGYESLDARLDYQDSYTKLIGKETANAIQPLYIETLASFGRYGTGVPSGIANYTGGNYVLTVDGTVGDNFFTVTAGKIADAGQSAKWPAVIENADLTYEGYQVTGTDGVDKVYIYPNVKKTVTGVKLGNLHDANQGQHYTELGYKAFGQHIFNNAGHYSQRTGYIARFLNTDTESSWTILPGTTSITYNRGLATVDATAKLVTGDNDRSFTFVTDAAGEGIEWELPIDKRTGYFEGFFGILSGGAVNVECYVDDILMKTVTISKELTRVVFDYSYATKAKVKVLGVSTTATTVRVGNCYWWSTEKVSANVFNEVNKKAVYIGDSWGVFHNEASPREIERLWKKVNPSALLVNKSQSGMTTKYARTWFEQYVTAEKPDIVVIEYFTNDINTIITPSTGLSRTSPDGSTYNTAVTESEYYENIRWMINRAIENNIQPVIVMPSSVAGDTQTQYHAKYGTKLANGGSIIPANATFQNLNAVNSIISKLYVDDIEVKTAVNKALGVLVNSYGMELKPKVQLYSGNVLKITNNDGSNLATIRIDKLLGSLFPSIELDGIAAEQGLKLPNTQVVDNANVFKIKTRTGKTVSKIEIGEGVTGITEIKTPIQIGTVDTLPSPTQFTRFQEVILKGGTGIADKRYICIKDASDGYTWKEL